jgi:hypothetical protein
MFEMTGGTDQVRSTRFEVDAAATRPVGGTGTTGAWVDVQSNPSNAHEAPIEHEP